MLRGKAWLPGQTQGLCFRIQVHDNQSPWKQGAPVCLAKILVSTNGLSCSSFQQKIVANEGFSSGSQTKKSKNRGGFYCWEGGQPIYCWWILLLVDFIAKNPGGFNDAKFTKNGRIKTAISSCCTGDLEVYFNMCKGSWTKSYTTW